MLAGILLAAPPLLLLGLLLLGRYPGERTLVAFARRRGARRCPAVRARPVGLRRRVARMLPRGGRLVADAIAGRGPPAAPAGTVASR